MLEPAIQLDYAKRPAWHRRGWFGWMVVGMALIAVAGAAARWGPQKWERAKLLYWQWRCMHYTAPADEVVFDQEANGRSALLSSTSSYNPQIEADSIKGTTTAAVTELDCEAQFAKMVDNLEDIGRQPPIVFLHDRASRAGRHYLIILRGCEIPFMRIAGVPMDFDGITPGGWRDDPSAVRDRRDCKEGAVPLLVDSQIRIYAGQADPADETHFTIRYIENGKPGVVDGYVDDHPNPVVCPGDCGFIASLKLIPRQ